MMQYCYLCFGCNKLRSGCSEIIVTNYCMYPCAPLSTFDAKIDSVSWAYQDMETHKALLEVDEALWATRSSSISVMGWRSLTPNLELGSHSRGLHLPEMMSWTRTLKPFFSIQQSSGVSTPLMEAAATELL